MSPAVVGSIITAILALVGWYVKWKITQSDKNALLRAQAEREKEALKKSIEALYAKSQAYQSEINGITSSNLSVTDINELLARPIDATELPVTTPTKNPPR
jgi:hypothetical protein